MATANRFEDLEAWKKARELNRRVYRLTREGPITRDFGLCDQMRRASVSVMCNIAEGFERGGRKEFLQFLSVAKGSVGELRAQLVAALDAPYIEQATFDDLVSLAIEVSRIIAGLMRYLQTCDVPGPKYHATTANTRPEAGSGS